MAPAGRTRRCLDFQRQNNRKPARCHRTTVSGRMMTSASRVFGNRWQAQPSTNLSTARNDIRFGLPRRNTMICCLSTRTSASSAARDRNRSTTIQKKLFCRDPTSRRRASDSASHANWMEFTTGTGNIQLIMQYLPSKIKMSRPFACCFRFYFVQQRL